jgi:hypothetical protein
VPFSRRIALACALCLLAATPAGAATFYVAPGGSDRASGTKSSPWKSIRRVNRQHLRPGDTVVLAGGVYAGQLRLDDDGTAAAPITITSSGRAIIDQRRSGHAAITVNAAHVRVSHLELRGIAHRPSRRSDDPAVYLGRSRGVWFSDMVVRGAASSFFNGSLVATNIRLTRVTATGIAGAAGAGVEINNWKSTGWRVTDSRFTGYGDSCILDQAGRSRFVHVTVRHCGYGNLTYGTHGLYLKGPSAIVENSDISDIKGGQCISPRAGAVIRGNRLHHCTIGIGYFDYARRGGSQSLRILGNDLSATSITAIYVDSVGTSPDTRRAHRIVLTMTGNHISATGPDGAPLRGPAVSIRAPVGRGSISVRSSGNVIRGSVRAGAPFVSVFSNRSRWPAGSTYRASQNSYWDVRRRADTRFVAPGIARPYQLQQFTAALQRGGSSSHAREWRSRVSPGSLAR